MSDNNIKGDGVTQLKLLMQKDGVDEAIFFQWATKMELTKGPSSLKEGAIHKIVRSWGSIKHLVNLENRSIQDNS